VPTMEELKYIYGINCKGRMYNGQDKEELNDLEWILALHQSNHT
jgi:hypothetical protein